FAEWMNGGEVVEAKWSDDPFPVVPCYSIAKPLGELSAMTLDWASAETLTPTEARNKFCYEEWQRGQILKEINAAVKKRPEWEPYEDDRGVRSAIKAWADPRGLPIRKGQPGRRK